MAIALDFTIYPKTKVIRHTSGTSVYTAVQFYSWLMNTFDEPGYLTYQTPIKFNTPTSFTMINGWFLDNGEGSYLLKYLYGGGIDTSGYATVSDPIYMLDLDIGDGTPGYTSFVSGDRDLNVQDDGVTVGPLLAYINTYPSASKGRIWIRDTRTTPASVADNSEMTVVTGTGTGTADGASASGEEVYLNLFTINSFAGTPNPQVYIYQRHPVTASGYNTRVRIVEWSHLANWDRSLSTGSTTAVLDVLFPIRLGGALIDNGNFTTLVRQTGDTFTFVESTVTEAGRNPIAMETAADTVNITKGEHYMLYDGATPTPTFSAGDVIQDVATGGAAPPTWYAEVVAHTSFAGGATGVLTLRALRGAPADNNSIFVGASDTTANVNGTVGDTLLTYTGTDPTTLGQTMTGGTSGAIRLLRAFDATANYLALQDNPAVTGTGRNPYYKDFSSGEVLTGGTDGTLGTTAAVSTTLISGYNDITVAHMNGTVVVNTFGGGNGGVFIKGERVTWTGGGPAIVIDSTATSLSLANVADETALTTSALTITGDISGATCLTNGTGGLTDDNTEDYNFNLKAAAQYSVFIEGGSIYNTGRSLSDIYAYLQFYLRDGQSSSSRVIYASDNTAITQIAAEEYIKCKWNDTAFPATKTAPYGTLAGSTFFGARGIWLQGMRTADNNNVKFTDYGGTLQEPDPSIDLTISNTRQYDRVAVYLKHATLTLPKKDQYNSHATANVQSDSTFERDATSFPNDTPASGSFIVVDTSAGEEHRYRYLSWATTVLTLPTEKSGSVTTDTDSQVLISTNTAPSNFTTGGTSAVQVGDIVRRTNNEGGWAYVVSVDSATQLTTTLLSTPAQPNWDGTATADAYEINSLVVTYTDTPTQDTFFIPYMDFIEDTGTDGSPGSQAVTVNYVANRTVIIEARNVQNTTQIIPFETTGTITSTGLSQSIIRNEDTVYV